MSYLYYYIHIQCFNDNCKDLHKVCEISIAYNHDEYNFVGF